MRINRYLAACGLASRRKSEAYILEGKIKVNGKVIKDLSYRVEEGDSVTFNGKDLALIEPSSFLFNKPYGVMVSHKDPHANKFIYDYLPKNLGLFAAGRLDVDSEGLIFITNIGGDANALIHPSSAVEKEYLLILDKKLTREDMKKLLKGVQGKYDHYKADMIEEFNDEICGHIENWPGPEEFTNKKYKIVIHEGKKREIRRMFSCLGYKVERLVRIRIGRLYLDGIGVGKYRKLTDLESQYIRSLTD